MIPQMQALLLMALGLLLAGPAAQAHVVFNQVSPRLLSAVGFQLTGPVGVGLWGRLLRFLEFLLLNRASQSH